MIEKAIKNCMERARLKGWEKTYWAFDIHGTMIKPNFEVGKLATEFYPGVVEAMQKLSKRKDIVRILYTCSHPHEIIEYLEYFKKHNIHFDYVNENPEVIDGAYGHYKNKFYFNVLFEDKAGFDGNSDWEVINQLIITNKI